MGAGSQVAHYAMVTTKYLRGRKYVQFVIPHKAWPDCKEVRIK